MKKPFFGTKNPFCAKNHVFLVQVRLICNDGTRYTKDIDIVRKCACTKKCYWLTDAATHNPDTELTENSANIFETDQNILNLKPPANPAPKDGPYKLTFLVENDTKHVKQMQLSSDRRYHDDVDEMTSSRYPESAIHEPTYCVLSAFLYFVTITTFAYLAMLWIKQKMHVQIEQLHWW